MYLVDDLTESELKRLVDAKTVRDARFIWEEDEGGYELVVQYGESTGRLVAARRNVRYFKSPVTAIKFARMLGLKYVAFELGPWQS